MEKPPNRRAKQALAVFAVILLATGRVCRTSADSGVEPTAPRPPSLKERILKQVAVAAVVMYFPPNYPTAPHVPPHLSPPPPQVPPQQPPPGSVTPPPEKPPETEAAPEPSTFVSGMLGLGMVTLFAIFRWWRG